MTLIQHDQTVQLARPTHAPRLSSVLTAAFWDDPVFRWAMPGDLRRRAALPAIFDAFVAGFTPLGATFTTATGGGAALWAPPGEAADLSGLDVDRVGAEWPKMLEVMGLLESSHPHEDCWYLNLLAVEPAAQGRGIGTALLRAVLDRADADGVPAYLEATSEANRRLYERHGFEVAAELRVSDCPPLWAMWHRR
jgi:GNAT superfamily N-acetyltransferase